MNAPVCVANSPQNRNFDFGGQSVRVHVEDDGRIWWVAKDVCSALDIADHRQAVDRLSPDERGRYIVPTPSGNQQMTAINEPGLYRLIFTSRKKAAEKFQRWVFHEVLPEIRKTGGYQQQEPQISQLQFLPCIPKPRQIPQEIIDWERKVANAMMQKKVSTQASAVATALMVFGPEDRLAVIDEIEATFLPGAARKGIDELVRKGYLHENAQWHAAERRPQKQSLPFTRAEAATYHGWLRAEVVANKYGISDIDLIHAWGREGAIKRKRIDGVWRYRINRDVERMFYLHRQTLQKLLAR